MRWFVEISSVGLKPGPSTTLCVEAPQWQPALQKARALRGDVGALSNFSIELLEDGFRAIDPAARLRYIVRRAPDDAALSDGTEPAVEAGEPFQKRPIAYTMEFASEGEAVVNEPSALSGSVKIAPTLEQAKQAKPAEPAEPAEPAGMKKLKQTMAFGSSGDASVLDARIVGLTSTPRAGAPEGVTPTIPSQPAQTVPSLASIPRPPVPLPVMPDYQVISRREENPTERSPLHYREMVFVVAPGTAEEDARRLLLDRFEQVRGDLDEVRPGKLINLAIFDHVFQGRPLRRPMATLSWKDWKNEAPEILFPLRDGTASTPPKAPSMPPKAPSVPPAAPVSSAAVPSSASAASGPTLPSALLSERSAIASSPSAAAPVAVVKPAKAPSTPPPAVMGTPARALAPAPAPASVARGARPSDAFMPPTVPIPTKPAAGVSPSAPAPAPAVAKLPSTPAPAPVPVVDARPKKRLSGEDLLAELFEACGDMQFLTDSLEGADFVLKLTLEKLPSEVGLVSFFDINKREFVVVQQMGGPRSALCQRQPEHAHVASTVMRTRRAAVINSAAEVARATDDRWKAIGVDLRSLICTPVELGGRYLGLIELANPLDGGSFNEGDGNALTYIGQQFGEFVAQHGVSIDPELIRERAEPALRRGR